MQSYTIEQFSQITGLNKILIRTWENRYNFLVPKRSSTNIRYYDDKMLIKGIKYAILVKNGYKISKLINHSQIELDILLDQILTLNNDKKTIEVYASKFIESSVNYNQELFEKTYKAAIDELGLVNLYSQIIVKAMSRISVLYLSNKISPAHEHFLSENIKLKLSSEIEKEKERENTLVKEAENQSKRWVLFLPENEYHDIGLLFTHFLLKTRNHKTIYLGQNVPRESILSFNKENTTLILFISLNRNTKFIKELIEFINLKLNKTKTYIITRDELKNKKHSNIEFISSIKEFIKII